MICKYKSTKSYISKFCYVALASVICLRIVQWSNGSISNNSIQHKSKLNGSKYFYISPSILINISHFVKYSLADNMGQGKNPTVPSQNDAPEESDQWTAWQLCISARWRSNMPFQRRRKWHIPMASYGKRSQGRGGVSISPHGSLMVI